MLERELRAPVEVWMRAQGLLVVHNFHLWHMVDMYGVRFRPRVGRAIPKIELGIAVELKVDDVAGVLQQTKHCREQANFVYAAMPAARCRKMRADTIERFAELGVGLLTVHPTCGVRIGIPARDNDPVINDRIRRNLWRRTRDQRTDGRWKTEGGQKCS